MAVIVEISPVPIIHSAAYHVFISGLVAGHTVSVNTYNDAPFAGTPVTGTADANGEFACSITAQAPLGPYILVVEDTHVTVTVVALQVIQVT